MVVALASFASGANAGEAADEGASVSGGFTGVWQQVDAAGADTGERTARANVRADVALRPATAHIGAAEGRAFLHLRAGVGQGVMLRPIFTSTPNSTGFAPQNGDGNRYAVSAEAWYQLTLPLPGDAASPGFHRRVEVTAGKLDPFVFFDQNAIADDETMRFLNNAFVHNPLLDSGGDTAADNYGFAPGVRVAWVGERGEGETWSASLGLLGAGPGAHLEGPFGGPLAIGQIEATRPWFGQRPGTWRAYAWTNGRTVDFADAFERHSGWGLSVDQPVRPALTVFARFGKQIRGHVRFDRALTLGGEMAGSAWGRADDAVGVTGGWLAASRDWRDATASTALTGYAASGTERIAEVYYRVHVDEHVDLSPDLQFIGRPAGDRSARNIVVAGIHARVGF